MASFHLLLLLLLNLLCSVVQGSDKSFMIPVDRAPADSAFVNSLSALRKRQSGTNPAELGKILYWFGNFSVGDTQSLRLLIDTGSSDLILNNNLYKPSRYEKPYPHKNFSIVYEGVNRKGFGFETIRGTVTRDVVSAAGLTVYDQAVGAATYFKYKDSPQLPFANPGQGIIGFLGADNSVFRPGAPGWIFSLCRRKLISQCRFGLAFGTSGKGFTVFGKLAKKLYKGDITVTPRKGGWRTSGDIAIDDKIIIKNQTIFMDCGTDNIQGPLHVVREIFKKLGYQTKELHGGPNPYYPDEKLINLIGYFPCDKPPKLGFSFPAEVDLKSGQYPNISKKSKIFNVSPAVWDVYNHGNNNCTSILGGTNALTNPKSGRTVWLVGQSFYAGHYVDHNIEGTIGFADLKDPSTASS